MNKHEFWHNLLSYFNLRKIKAELRDVTQKLENVTCERDAAIARASAFDKGGCAGSLAQARDERDEANAQLAFAKKTIALLEL